MPFQSKEQRKWAYAQQDKDEKEGKKPPIDADEWEEATEREHKKLPERKKPKKKSILLKEAMGEIDWMDEDAPKDPNDHPKKRVIDSKKESRKSRNDIRRVLSQIRFN